MLGLSRSLRIALASAALAALVPAADAVAGRTSYAFSYGYNSWSGPGLTFGYGRRIGDDAFLGLSWSTGPYYNGYIATPAYYYYPPTYSPIGWAPTYYAGSPYAYEPCAPAGGWYSAPLAPYWHQPRPYHSAPVARPYYWKGAQTAPIRAVRRSSKASYDNRGTQADDRYFDGRGDDSYAAVDYRQDTRSFVEPPPRVSYQSAPRLTVGTGYATRNSSFFIGTQVPLGRDRVVVEPPRGSDYIRMNASFPRRQRPTDPQASQRRWVAGQYQTDRNGNRVWVAPHWEYR